MPAPRVALSIRLLAGTVPLALGGCGGAEDDGRADKSPKAIVSEASDALGKLKSYHVEGTQVDEDGSTKLQADVDARGPLRIDLDQSGRTAVLLLLAPQETYIKANAAFWRDSAGADGAGVAQQLTDRWVKVPPAGAGTFTKLADTLRPSTLSRCVLTGLGTLEGAGTRKEGGQDAVVVRDAGDRPGTSPGELLVAADGAARVLRTRQTGTRKPGGRLDPRCQDADSTTSSSDLRFSRFDEPLTLKAPSNPLDLSSAAGGDGTTA